MAVQKVLHSASGKKGAEADLLQCLAAHSQHRSLLRLSAPRDIQKACAWFQEQIASVRRALTTSKVDMAQASVALELADRLCDTFPDLADLDSAGDKALHAVQACCAAIFDVPRLRSKLSGISVQHADSLLEVRSQRRSQSLSNEISSNNFGCCSA